MNKNALCYMRTALSYFLPVEELQEIEGFVLKIGNKNYYFGGSGTPFNNGGAIKVARDKYCMNQLLKKAGFPVPNATSINLEEFLEGQLKFKIQNLTFPLVAKPQIGKLGNNVLCNIKTYEQLENYLENNLPQLGFVIIEEFHGNMQAYRVLIFKGQILGVILREPAAVVGDGQNSLKQLIELSNAKRQKISDTLKPLQMDDGELLARLNELNINLDYLPKMGEKIALIYTSNASRGGTYISLKNQMAKENADLLRRAAQTLGMDLVGFDIQCEDICKPMLNTNAVIIEANDGPSVRIHEQPLEGYASKVTKKMIRSIIYKHPLSYLKILFQNQHTAIYTRGVSFILLFIVPIVFLFRHGLLSA